MQSAIKQPDGSFVIYTPDDPVLDKAIDTGAHVVTTTSAEYIDWLNSRNPTPDQIWQAIKHKRKAIEDGGVQVQGHWYHTDDESKPKIQSLVTIANAATLAGAKDADPMLNPADGQPIKWQTMAGTYINLTYGLAKQIFGAAVALSIAAHTAAATHKATLYASTNPAAYDYSTGWPAIYEAAV